MPKESPHFDRKELECKCGCGWYNLKPEVLGILEQIRFRYGGAVVVSSACRCPKHNAEVEGGPEHPDGEAVDIVCKTARLRYLILETAFRESVPRIGIAETFVHLGISQKLPREVLWTYPAKG